MYILSMRYSSIIHTTNPTNQISRPSNAERRVLQSSNAVAQLCQVLPTEKSQGLGDGGGDGDGGNGK